MLVHFRDTGSLADGLFQPNLETLAPDAQAKPAIDADEVVRYPHERKPRNDISAPVIEQQPEMCRQQNRCRYVVAEAVLTGEQIEELAGGKTLRFLAASNAAFANFSKQLFVGDGPGNR